MLISPIKALNLAPLLPSPFQHLVGLLLIINFTVATLLVHPGQTSQQYYLAAQPVTVVSTFIVKVQAQYPYMHFIKKE